jgi:hypothetical protein
VKRIRGSSTPLGNVQRSNRQSWREESVVTICVPEAFIRLLLSLMLLSPTDGVEASAPEKC